METEAQRKANLNYRKKSVKQVVTAFYPADEELYEFLQKQGNKAGFIKSLIREAMEKESAQD